MYKFDHEIISTVILPIPLIQERQLTPTGEKVCAQVLVKPAEEKCQ